MNFFTEQLIEFVKENECIYNSKSTAYKNTQFKDLIWQKIAVELNASVDDCKTRWKSLRDRFGRELKKKNLPSADSGAEETHWICFDKLLFLKDNIRPRRIIGGDVYEVNNSSTTDDANVKFEYLGCESENSLDSNHFSSISDILTIPTTAGIISSPKQSNKKRKLDINETFCEFLGEMKKLIADKSDVKTDDKLFMEMILAKLDKLSSRDKNKMQLDILTIVNQKLDEMDNTE